MSGVAGALQRIEDWFHKVRVDQGSFEFRHVLGEYVDEESIKQGFPSNKKATRESGKIAIDGGCIRNIAGRVYSSRVLVIQDGTEIDELEKINRCQETYSELKRCLTSAGQELEFQPIYEYLPPEITLQNDCALRWLLYLHYSTKPDRKTWDLISSQAIVAKAFGQEPPSGKSNLWNEIPSVVGPFSFDLLGQNSYSMIQDIATSSILAIRLTGYGKIRDSQSADNKTRVDYGLPESVIQKAEKEAKQEAEYARMSRLTDASDGVRHYRPNVTGQVFCEEMSKRILAFGQVLKDDGWVRHLSAIQAPWAEQHKIDAFRVAVEILQTAVSGDEKTVLARLKNIYETDHIKDANLRTAKRDYRQWVFEALRREIVFKLREREYSTSKDQAKHYQDTGSQFQAPGWGAKEDTFNANQTDKSTIDDGRGYTAAQARKQLGLKDSQFSHYRGKAGVAPVKKGKTYSTNAVITIARYIYFRSGAIQETKDFCRDFLNEHGENIPVS